MVVLVDRDTASASEIVTAALQDHRRATVVGTHTYGKGVFQELEPLSGGGAIKITVGEYFTPNGRNLGGGGVKEGAGITPEVRCRRAWTPNTASKWRCKRCWPRSNEPAARRLARRAEQTTRKGGSSGPRPGSRPARGRQSQAPHAAKPPHQRRRVPRTRASCGRRRSAPKPLATPSSRCCARPAIRRFDAAVEREARKAGARAWAKAK